MKLYTRVFSTLLAVILMLGSLAGISVVSVGAAEATDDLDADERIENTYVKTVYNTPEEKLATMTLMLERSGVQLYVDSVSGEVATVDTTTGNILFSNPYDVASSTGSDSTKKQILSQLVVQYVDNGTTKYLYSFEEAAMREQITVLNIKNGVRVEYTIGREESRKLVPRWISVESFEKYIQTPLKEAVEAGELGSFYYEKFMAYFPKQSVADKTSKKAKEQLILQYPICAEMDIHVFATDASSVELNWCESYIKAYCEDYSFEQMDADHELTGYEATDEQYPVFKMALEYSLDESGALSVRLPCNGLRYDMSTYTLEYISILPYMGAGNSKNAGGEYECYNFYPDGSGSLFDFEQLNTKSTTTVRGKVYGLDFAYHNITGTTYQKTIRYPVYGTVAAETFYTFTYSAPEYKTDSTGKSEATGNTINVTETISNTVLGMDEIEAYVTEQGGTLLPGIDTTSYQRGYVAVIESGESLAEIATYHAGSLSDYNTMMNYFNPKPKDSYDISDSISVTNSSTWTVVSERKYTGNITIRYQMLTDEALGTEAQKEDSAYTYYDTSWLGMAEAYRDYLVAKGTLSKLTSDELEEDIPLYLEVFGALETQQTVMTIPVDVMTPLTTFENVLEMYNALSGEGNDVKNINFKLTGFANGGMYSTVPAALKWEKAVGGSDWFEKLIEEAQKMNEKEGYNFGLYPDFDFAYIQSNTLFDSTSLKKDAIKTIDNRYSSLRQYSATQQAYVSFYQLAVAPSRYSKFYTKLIKNYQEYDIDTMSVASLGTALNSDFDEDEPYNREDSKKHTVQAFEDLKSAGYSLMTEGANAYSWGYVDHIINVDLDSSRYIKSSASVPFIGAVLHGYVQFAGTPLNEEGDTDYAILRAIENGAGMYFILSYQNTDKLKEDSYLSQYYSVRYDIWEDDVVSFYQELNNLLKDVQDKVIIDHQFLNDALRVLDLDELQADLEEQLKKAEEEEQKKQDEIETAKVIEVADAWKNAESASKDIQNLIDEMKTINSEIEANYVLLQNQVGTMLPAWIQDTQDTISNSENGIESEESVAAIENLNRQIVSIKNLAVTILTEYEAIKSCYAEVEAILADVEAAKAIITNTDSLSAEVKTKMLAILETYIKAAQDLEPNAKAELDLKYDYVKDDIGEASAVAIAVNALKNFESLDEALKNACAESMFTAADIHEAVKVEDDKENVEDGNVGEDDENKYLVDNNQVVVVTYGDRNDATHEKKAVKSFILNYNNFAVKVDYLGYTYTIPSGGYVVIYH